LKWKPVRIYELSRKNHVLDVEELDL